MSSFSSFWTDRTILRLNREAPYIHLHFVAVFVRDQGRSLRFYVDQLGFVLVIDHSFDAGERWIEVAPPDGTAKLALVAAKPGSEEEKLIGRFTWVFFLTEDVSAKFEEWRNRGVHFQFPPQQPAWGGMLTRFEDPDGNSFGLIGFDEATREVEARRRAHAEKAEAERQSAQELEIAKQVQVRLFPQRLPATHTLDYAGVCIQAHQVGGDYYDFIDLGQKQLCLAVGDISGKGIGAALLMANLQANLRSQSAIALHEPERLLRSVNQLFYDNTGDSSYATLFFAAYDDETRRLTYFNCGHLPALVLRQDGSLQRLESASTVLGLFNHWDCSAQSCRLSPGDTLVIYTDGVTESSDGQGEEFGEQRLVEIVRENRHLRSQAILASIVDKVRRFSTGEQHDDITAIVAKCKEAN